MIIYIEQFIYTILGEYFFDNYAWADALLEILLFIFAILLIILFYKFWKFLIFDWWRNLC